MRIVSTYVSFGALALLCACNSRVTDDDETGGAASSNGGSSGNENGGTATSVGGQNTDDGGEGGVGGSDDGDGGTDPGDGADAGATDSPVYAIQFLVYGVDDDATTYVVLTDTLDLTEISLDGAREFPGYASIATVGGKLLVSDGAEPVITQFEITPELTWVEGESLSFANEGISGIASTYFEKHWLVDEHTAYLTLDVTSRILWDPTDFVILDTLDDTNLDDERGSLLLDATLNRQPRVSDGPVLKPFYYHDEDWFEFADSTSVAVYDRETGEETSIVDVPCPALELGNRDEAGNTYLSPWTFGPELSLYGEGPELCLRRIKADGTLDEEWTPDLTEWTDGRPVKVLRYLRDGKAMGTVLHHEEVDTDFSATYFEDEVAVGELEEHWRLWLFDLEEETAEPIDGIGSMNSGFHWATFGDRSFVFLPYEGWGKTKVYEVGADGTATERFDATGRLSEWIRVR